jgi:hypothetical protein
MESITQAAEEILIDSLSFKLPGSGQYIQERRSVSFQTEGSNSYSPNSGTRVMRFKLTTEGWLDPSTVRVFFDVVNNDAPRVLRPIGAVHGFFRRLRIMMRGVVIEDIMDYNRVAEMFDILSTPQARLMTKAEGFGGNIANADISTTATLQGITTLQTVCFKPLCGIFQQTKFIPLRYCPLEIELELADMTDPILTETDGIGTIVAGFDATISRSWKLESCQLKCDICTLDNALDNNYTSHLLGGKNLNIVYNTYISNIQTVVAPDTQINVSRSLTRLRSVFLSLERNFKNTAGADTVRAIWYNKPWNNFYSPMAQDSITKILTHNEDNEITSLQLQIGSFLIPQYPIRSHAECFYSLRKALGIQSNSIANIDIDGNSYRNNKFIVGIDCEKILGLAFTGMNTKNSLMTVRMKTKDTNAANRFHILLTAEMILEISDAGITVYD